LPPAFGLEFAALQGRDFRSGLIGDAFVPASPTAESPAESSYAYAFEWSPYFAPRALHRVLNADVLARVATKPFAAQTTAGPQEFSRGAIVVSLDRQEHGRAEIHELMPRSRPKTASPCTP
jgi:hypothetical protein